MNEWGMTATFHPWVFDLLVVIMGLCIGSFLNVCIYRMPRGLNISWPGSFCPKSGQPLHWWENVPLVSYICLGGKGRISKEPISIRYPLVEAATAIIFLVLWKTFSPQVAIAYMVMASMMLAGSLIDWDFKIIPDSLTMGGVLVGLIASFFVPALHGIEGQGIAQSFASLGIGFQGMLLGSAIVMWVALLGEAIFKREAMGFGDVKLMGFIGAMMGWEGAVFALFGGAVVGMVVAIVTLISEKAAGKDSQFFGREIPFGPMLCVAAFAFAWMKPMVVAYWTATLGGLGL